MWSTIASIAAPIVGAALGGSQGSPAPVQTNTSANQSSTSNQGTTTLPWNADALKQLMDQAQSVYGSNQLVLPSLPTLPGLPNLANTDTLNAAITAAINPVMKAFTDPGGVLSSIRSDFGTNGTYGGSRQALAEGTAAGRLSDTAANTAAAMADQLYGTNLNYNLARGQQDITNATNLYNMANQQAMDLFNSKNTNLANLAQIMTAIAGKGGTTTGTQTTNTTSTGQTVQPQPSTPWWQGAAGGALLGQGLYDKLFQPTSGGSVTVGNPGGVTQIGNWGAS